VVVDETVVDGFVAELGKAMNLMYNADGKGAKVELDGDTDGADLFIAPTILSGVSEDMRIMQEEIFGPILCIVSFVKREDAIATIRRRPKPLGVLRVRQGSWRHRLVSGAHHIRRHRD